MTTLPNPVQLKRIKALTVSTAAWASALAALITASSDGLRCDASPD